MMNLLKSSAAALFASTVLISPVAAQETDINAPLPETADSEIIVEGYSEKEVRHFLWRSLNLTGDSIARRTGEICIGIDNIGQSIARELTSRIKANIAAAGVDIAEEGCTINAAIVFHREPDQFVSAMKENFPDAFRTMYKPEARRLVKAGRPVYSWMFIPSEYRQLVSNTTDLAIQGPVFAAAATSRIRQEGPPGIGSSFTIVDTDKVDGMSTTQLADYLTLQVMIEFEPGALEYAPNDSILNLFYAGDPEVDAPQEMSRMDREMLSQLYNRRQKRLSPFALRHRIAANMIDTLEEDGLIKN